MTFENVDPFHTHCCPVPAFVGYSCTAGAAPK
jgi:hypothetical protein